MTTKQNRKIILIMRRLLPMMIPTVNNEKTISVRSINLFVYKKLLMISKK